MGGIFVALQTSWVVCYSPTLFPRLSRGCRRIFPRTPRAICWVCPRTSFSSAAGICFPTGQLGAGPFVGGETGTTTTTVWIKTNQQPPSPWLGGTCTFKAAAGRCHTAACPLRRRRETLGTQKGNIPKGKAYVLDCSFPLVEFF